jgi:hypothetical protein
VFGRAPTLEKIAPEFQIHKAPPWSSSTMDLKSRKTFGITPDFPPYLWHLGPTCQESRREKNESFICMPLKKLLVTYVPLKVEFTPICHWLKFLRPSCHSIQFSSKQCQMNV